MMNTDLYYGDTPEERYSSHCAANALQQVLYYAVHMKNMDQDEAFEAFASSDEAAKPEWWKEKQEGEPDVFRIVCSVFKELSGRKDLLDELWKSFFFDEKLQTIARFLVSYHFSRKVPFSEMLEHGAGPSMVTDVLDNTADCDIQESFESFLEVADGAFPKDDLKKDMRHEEETGEKEMETEDFSLFGGNGCIDPETGKKVAYNFNQLPDVATLFADMLQHNGYKRGRNTDKFFLHFVDSGLPVLLEKGLMIPFERLSGAILANWVYDWERQKGCHSCEDPEFSRDTNWALLGSLLTEYQWSRNLTFQEMARHRVTPALAAGVVSEKDDFETASAKFFRVADEAMKSEFRIVYGIGDTLEKRVILSGDEIIGKKLDDDKDFTEEMAEKVQHYLDKGRKNLIDETFLKRFLVYRLQKGLSWQEYMCDNPQSFLLGFYPKVRSEKQIKETLDKVVRGQEEAKRQIATAVFRHCQIIREKFLHPNAAPIARTNILLCGPSGCGKTELIRQLKEHFDLPVFIADSASYSETGYKGKEVTDMFNEIKEELTFFNREHTIVFLDEFDKLSAPLNCDSNVMKEARKGNQAAFLKLVEGITGKDGENSNEMLFIAGGAFAGLDDVIQRRKEKKAGKMQTGIGFSSELYQPISENDDSDEAPANMTPTAEDLIEYGLQRELVGRFPGICRLNALDKETMLDIFLHSEKSPLRDYRRLEAIGGRVLEVTPEAAEAIAEKALASGTGARALKGTLSHIMSEVDFELSEQRDVKILITEDCVRNGTFPEIIPLKMTAKRPASESRNFAVGI